SSCATSAPTRSPRRSHALPPASSAGGRGAFTALRAGRPSSTSRICCTTSTATLTCASAVEPAMCGIRTVFREPRMGESAGSGSLGKTSSAAPAIVPLSSAAASAPRSTTSPRAQFTITVVGFIFARASALIRLRVFSVGGVCSEITSALRSSSSSSTSCAPAARALASVANGSCAMTRIWKPAARRATSEPTRPMPTRPSVLPRSSRPMNFDRVHSPARTLRSASAMRRSNVSASAIVCSAADTMLPSGAFTTYTPCAVAAGTSMLSTPTPARPTTARRGAASKIFAVTFVSLRTMSASTSASREARSASASPVVVRTSHRSRSRTRPSSARGSATCTTGLLRGVAGGSPLAIERSSAPTRLSAGADGVRARTAGAGTGSRRLWRALRVGAERRGDRLTGLDRLVEVTQCELQGAEEVEDVLQRHEAEVTDADELALELALAAGDDRVVVVAQHADEVARVNARRRTERGDRRRCVRFVGEQRQVQCLQSAACRASEVLVAAEDRLEAFLGHETKCLLQRDVHGRRRRRALLERGLRRGEIEVRLRQVGLLVELPRALAHRDDGHAGWRTPCLLRAGDAHVDAPLVDLELGRAGAGDAVDDQQLARFADYLADLLQWIEDTGRGLVVLEHDGLRAVLALLLRELLANELGVDRAAQRDVDATSVNAVRLADRIEALAERAVDEDERSVAARERVRDGRFHRAGARRGEGEHITLRAQEVLQRARECGQQRGELGAAVVDHRTGRRGEHALGHHGRSWDSEVLGAVHVLSL